MFLVNAIIVNHLDALGYDADQSIDAFMDSSIYQQPTAPTLQQANMKQANMKGNVYSISLLLNFFMFKLI